jgi:orotate phosphoribosyltransferase
MPGTAEGRKGGSGETAGAEAGADREALIRLLLARSVERGDFVLASGQRSSYYIDCRKATMSAEGQRLIGRLGVEAIGRAGWTAQAVGGLTMGADPVAYAVAAASWGSPRVLDAFSVRKEAKAHGTGRQIEGNFAAGARVVVVEDVITSGGSAFKAIAAVEAAGGEVAGVLALVDREQGGRQALEAAGHRVVTLLTTTDLGLVPS